MKKQLLLLFVTSLFSLNSFSQSSFITQVLDCSTGCSDLTVDFPLILETSDYTVESIPFNPPTNLSGLENSLFLNVDDIWSSVINLPFAFSFYGATYTDLIIGANGVLSFDVSNASNLNGWQFTETLPNNTNTTLSDANIFGAGHDIDPASSDGTHEIGYQVFGTAPFRMFVVSFFNIAQFSCNELKTTQMMILYETTNVIDVLLVDKPLCTAWNNGNAVVGIQNPAGTEAVVPPGRNTGAWTASSETWRFNPSGVNNIENVYTWYNPSGAQISSEASINICPAQEEIYTAEVTYYNPNDGATNTVIEDITLYTTLVGQQPNDLVVCSAIETDVNFNLTVQTAVITGGSSCSTVSYYLSLVDAENETNAITNPSYYPNISNPETIYVRVEDNTTASYETTMFDLIVNVLLEVQQAERIACATSQGLATFTLSEMNDEITIGNTDYNVAYYASIADAENETNILPDIYETANTQAIYARVNSLISSCYEIVECYLNVANGVLLNNLQDLVQCGTNGVAQFDLVAHVYQQLNGNVTPEVTFYLTQEDANNEINVIFPADNYTNISNPQTIYVRAQDLNSGCFTYGNFVISIEDGTTVNTPTPLTVCDFDGALDGFYVFSLNQKNTEILGGLDPADYSLSYHETQADAASGTNALNDSQYYNTIANIQTIYVRVENINVGCVSYTTLDLIVDTDCQVACEENVAFCYGNDNTTQYTYTNDNGVPLTVIFNAGQVEVNYDALIVLDSDGVTNLNAATPYGNNGDVTGLTFTSTGDSITILVQSDGSISCEVSNYIEIDFYVYCIVESGSIEVNAFIDENIDTVFDASEVNFSNGVFTYEVNNDGVTNYVNSSSGSFIIPNAQDGDSYDISFIMFDAFNSCLAQTFTLVENVVAVDGEITEVNFPLTSISDCNDIAVYLVANAPPRPGVLYNNSLIIENLGSGTVSGSVEFTQDATVTLNNVNNVNSGNTVTNTATGFIIDFNNLLAGDTEQVTIQLNIPTNLNIGDLVTNTALYDVSDINVDNNESILTQEVVNSYDPNNKLESHGPEIKLVDFTSEDYLYYTINFQNLGTAEAIDIRVEDMLDMQLDASTFKMLNASHDYMLTRVDHNLTWQFDDINLPSESMDAPNSHGYVYFKIKPLAGYQEGDIIPNVAAIYFDFNPAITTNTFETKFVTTLSVDEFSTLGYTMYPNPANSTVNVQFNTAVAEKISVNIYNVQGKLVSNPNSAFSKNKISFNVSNLSQGMYFLELKGESFKIVEKLIVE